MAAIPAKLGAQFLKQMGLGALAGGGGDTILKGVLKARQEATGVSKELFGYDFIGLITKIVIFNVIAYLFAKFMEAVILGTNFTNSFVLGAARLFGVTLPSKTTLPAPIVELFETGYGEHKIKYWDFVKALTTALIVFEAVQYYRANKNLGGQVSPFTIGIFTLLVSAMTLVTVPEIMQRLKGSVNVHFQKSSGVAGESIDAAVEQLLPNTEVIYGWKNTGITQTYTSRADGWLALIIIVPDEAPNGVNTIFFDQRPWGGPYYEGKFEKLPVVTV